MLRYLLWTALCFSASTPLRRERKSRQHARIQKMAAHKTERNIRTPEARLSKQKMAQKKTRRSRHCARNFCSSSVRGWTEERCGANPDHVKSRRAQNLVSPPEAFSIHHFLVDEFGKSQSHDTVSMRPSLPFYLCLSVHCSLRIHTHQRCVDREIQCRIGSKRHREHITTTNEVNHLAKWTRPQMSTNQPRKYVQYCCVNATPALLGGIPRWHHFGVCTCAAKPEKCRDQVRIFTRTHSLTVALAEEMQKAGFLLWTGAAASTGCKNTTETDHFLPNVRASREEVQAQRGEEQKTTQSPRDIPIVHSVHRSRTLAKADSMRH